MKQEITFTMQTICLRMKLRQKQLTYKHLMFTDASNQQKKEAIFVQENMREKQKSKKIQKEQKNKMDETSRTTQNNCAEQLSAADIMLMQAQGKEIPSRTSVQTSVQKTPEIDKVISSVIEARKNQSDAVRNPNKNLIAQVLKGYALINGVAGILALSLLDRLGVFAVVITLASLVASFGIYAAGEALQLLQTISNNTQKTAKLLEEKKI